MTNKKSIKSKQDYIISIAIFLIVIFSRLIFSSDNGVYFGFDGGNFALAVQDYSIADDRPHLPGYYLHIQIIKAVNYIIDDLNKSMIFLSAIYSALSASLIYLFVLRWFSRKISVLFVFLVITNPYVWFYGCVTEIYPFDLFFSALIVAIGLSKKWIYFLPIVIALGMGIRQSSAVLLFPLYVYLWYLNYKTNPINKTLFLITHIIAIILFCLWFIPMVNSAGGLFEYLNLYNTHSPLSHHGFLLNLSIIVSYWIYFVIPIGSFLVFALTAKFLRIRKIMINDTKKELELLILILFWTIPAILFFLIFHYSNAYIFVCIIGIFLISGYLINKGLLGTKILIFIIIAQIAVFFLLPYHMPHKETYFNRKSRTLSQFSIFLDRLSSNYNMSINHLIALDEFQKKIDTGINNCLDVQSSKEKIVIFVDPTCPIRERSLNVKYPDIVFITLNKREIGSFFRYHDITQESIKIDNNLFSKAFILSTKSFVDKYLTSIPIDKSYIGDIVFYRVDEKHADIISKRYNEIFVKE